MSITQAPETTDLPDELQRDPRDQRAAEDAAESARKGLGLSLTAIAAGALSSVTSAYLGSSLGTAGTIVGAALGSVVGAVATAIYTVGLQRTAVAVRTLAQRVTVRDASAPDVVETIDEPLARRFPALGRGRVSRRAWLVGGAALAALIAFVLSLTLITGVESATGTSLSGEQGTTIGRAQQQAASRSAAQPAADEPAVNGTNPEAAPSATTEPSAAPTASVAPTASPTATPAPSASTSPQPAATTPTAPATTAPAAPTRTPQPAVPSVAQTPAA